MSNFWNELVTPFTVLAPMEDVTDVAFRELISLHLPKPDVLFTEFTSSDGLASKGRDETIKKLKYSERQRPIVAQIWGTNPENMKSAAETVNELGFDGVDINMGCPDRAVVKKGSGAAHCTDPTLAKEIIRAVREGAGDMAVSVKTRLGLNKNIADEWIPFILEQKVDALTLHGRIAKHKSDVPANWDWVGKAVVYKNSISPNTKLIGNGDVMSYLRVDEYHNRYSVDGVMIGRGIFKNPWIFEKSTIVSEHTPREYIELLLKHLDLFNQHWGDRKNFEVMKKFFKMYIREFDGASELRQKLMECKKYEEVVEIINETIV